jgi:hypothetical protein
VLRADVLQQRPAVLGVLVVVLGLGGLLEELVKARLQGAVLQHSSNSSKGSTSGVDS